MTVSSQRKQGPAHGHALVRADGREWAPIGLRLVGAASVVIVVLLWLRGGGLTSLADGFAPTLTSLGRLAGLVAADLLLVQVWFMARVPWIEGAFGQDQLARWHRLVGFTSINLMLVHVVLITIGYAGTDRSSLLGEAWQLTTTYPGMLLAVAASAAIVMVAVTSIRAARRRLRYESWHLLHLYAYLGVGLALPHELWTGADFISAPLTRAYWWTIFIATAATVVVFRLCLPLWRSGRHQLRVESVVPESPGVTSVYVRGRDLHRLGVRAGQFFNWRFLTPTGWTRAHPYSLSAAPSHDLLRITVKDLGDGSGAAAQLRRGTRIIVEGPYGKLTGRARRRQQMVLIASGIGITPLRALLESERYRPGHATLIYRAASPNEFTFSEEIEAMAGSRGIRLFYLPGTRGAPDSWLPKGYGDAAHALRFMAPEIADSDVFVCGPQPWMASVVTTLKSVDVRNDLIHLERFSW